MHRQNHLTHLGQGDCASLISLTELWKPVKEELFLPMKVSLFFHFIFQSSFNAAFIYLKARWIWHCPLLLYRFSATGPIQHYHHSYFFQMGRSILHHICLDVVMDFLNGEKNASWDFVTLISQEAAGLYGILIYVRIRAGSGLDSK